MSKEIWERNVKSPKADATPDQIKDTQMSTHTAYDVPQEIQALPQDFVTMVVRELPASVRGLLKRFPGQVWVAGGFIRDVMSGERPKDIDVFFGHYEAYLEAGIWFRKNAPISNVNETANSVTYTIMEESEDECERYVVQFVDRVFNKTPEDCIKEFDFSICQAAVVYDSLVEKFFGFVTRAFAEDITKREMRYTAPERDEDAGASVLRMVKFTGRGWRISEPEIEKVLARFHSVLYSEPEFEAIKRVNHAFRCVGYGGRIARKIV